MTAADAVADQFLLVENRFGEGDVVDVGAAPVGVVEDQHVAFVDVVLADALHGFLRRALHRRKVDRAIRRLA